MNAIVQSWANVAISERIDDAASALQCYCRKPRSAKRLHRARKSLARLRAALEDIGALAGADTSFFDRVQLLHRLTGKVRDADVLLERTKQYAESIRAEGLRQELQTLRDALERRRRKARKRLRECLAHMPELHA